MSSFSASAHTPERFYHSVKQMKLTYAALGAKITLLPYLDGSEPRLGRPAAPQYRRSSLPRPSAAAFSHSKSTSSNTDSHQNSTVQGPLCNGQMPRAVTPAGSLTLSGECTSAPRSSSSVTDSFAPTVTASARTVAPAYKCRIRAS